MCMHLDFSGSSAVKESTHNRGNPCLNPGLGRFSWRRDRLLTLVFLGFPGGSDNKESAFSVGDLGWIPELGRSPGGGYGNPLQYSCLENPVDRGAWWAAVHKIAQSQTRLK